MTSLLHWLRPLVGLMAASGLLMACTTEEAMEAPPAPTVASPGIPESMGTPAPIASPATPPAAPDERRTGSPELDAIIEAVESRDIAALASMVRYQEIGCTHAEGIGGPPKCAPGQAEGEILRVLPGAECHGYWTDTATQHLGTFAHRAQGLYAVAAVAGDASLGGEWPAADTLLLFHADWFGQPAAFRLHLADGRIVASWAGCGPRMPADLVEYGIDGDVSLIAGPWEEPVSARVEVPVTGIGGVDVMIGAVAQYDILALIESTQRGMQLLPDTECVAIPNFPGDVECDAEKGEQPGDLVDVFAAAYCEGALLRDPNPELRRFLDGGPVLHSIVRSPGETAQSDLFQHGDYWLVYELTAVSGGGPEAVRLHINDDGDLLLVWYGCMAPLRELVTWDRAPLPRVEVTEVERP